MCKLIQFMRMAFEKKHQWKPNYFYQIGVILDLPLAAWMGVLIHRCLDLVNRMDCSLALNFALQK